MTVVIAYWLYGLDIYDSFLLTNKNVLTDNTLTYVFEYSVNGFTWTLQAYVGTNKTSLGLNSSELK